MRILIDGNNLAWQAFHALPELTFDRKRTEVAFGFMMRVLSIAQRFDTNKFAFFWDTNSWRRKEIFPGYKDRDPKKTKKGGGVPDLEKKIVDFARSQIETLSSEIIPELGFRNTFLRDGYEADDLIAFVTKTPTKEEYMIVSNDDDLLQLLDGHVRIYNLRQKKIRDIPWLFENKMVTQSQWCYVKAYAGCTSDKVPGIPDVGDITAGKIIRHEPITDRIANRLREKRYRELVKRNLKLVTLPFGGIENKHYKGIKIVDHSLNRRNFMRVFDRYRFIYFLKNFNKWEEAMRFRRVWKARKGAR